MPCSELLCVCLLLSFALAGCASRRVRLTETGFLSSYTDLKEDEESGMRVYRNPGVEIGDRYSKIIIAPVQFEMDPAVEADKINDEDKEILAGYFYEQLENGLSGNYEIADKAGADVLILRSAITNIVPNIGVLNLNWMSLMIGTGLGGASLEAELVDSLTGERMLAFQDARKGRKFRKGFAKWGSAEEALAFWAGIMAENLNQLKGKY